MTLTRRRFIRISAAAAGLGLLSAGRPARAGAAPVVWHGTMLGAVATMEIYDTDRGRSGTADIVGLRRGAPARAVVQPLPERSALVELNRTGVLV